MRKAILAVMTVLMSSTVSHAEDSQFSAAAGPVNFMKKDGSWKSLTEWEIKSTTPNVFSNFYGNTELRYIATGDNADKNNPIKSSGGFLEGRGYLDKLLGNEHLVGRFGIGLESLPNEDNNKTDFASFNRKMFAGFAFIANYNNSSFGRGELFIGIEQDTAWQWKETDPKNSAKKITKEYNDRLIVSGEITLFGLGGEKNTAPVTTKARLFIDAPRDFSAEKPSDVRLSILVNFDIAKFLGPLTQSSSPKPAPDGKQ